MEYSCALNKRNAFVLSLSVFVVVFIGGGVLLHEGPLFFVIAPVVIVLGGYGGWRIASRALD